MAEALSIQKLNELYTRAESVDRELFAEQKSNVQLVSGRHFEKASRRLYTRMKDVRAGDEQTRIRLAKNHIHKIARTYVNEILSQAPGVRVLPHTESELADQKAAEIANSVWQDAKHRYRLAEKIRDWGDDFIDLGECAVKLFWDKYKGKQVGWEQEVDDLGQPLFVGQDGNPTSNSQAIDPMTGQVLGDLEPMKSDRPVFSGDFVFETILPFNLLRDPNAETMAESRYLIVRKMMDIDEAKNLAGGDEEKVKFIQESAQTTFKVFDGAKGEYVDGKNQVMIREVFYRPCHKYPEGLYCLWTEHGIVVDPMPLPFGIFPIVWCGFQKIQTTPRAHSIIRNLRPLQANLNQLSSQQVQHQLSLGDDKIIVQAGAKIERGGELPGIRVLRVGGSGVPPTILPGRSGEQFLASIQATVEEMYDIANLGDMKQDLGGQVDPNTLLFRQMRHKKKFSLYAQTFETFLTDICALYLKLAQKYLPEDQLIKVVGKREYVNLAEFREIDDQSYSIKLESIGDDIETMLGKSLQIQQVLQYVGKDIPPEARGQIINAMPFLNGEQMFTDLTMDAKNVDSDILQMDRGMYVPARKGENHKYIIRRLTARMKDRSFDLLPEQVKAQYEQKRAEHEQIEAMELAEMKRLQSEFIPTGGALIGVDLFTNQPNSSGGMKTVRARIPYEAVNWLIKQLETQGTTQEAIEGLAQSDVVDIGRMTMNQTPQGSVSEVGSAGSQQQPMPMPRQGEMNGSPNDFNFRDQFANFNSGSGF